MGRLRRYIANSPRVSGVKCLRLCVARAVTPEFFEVLQQHQQVPKIFLLWDVLTKIFSMIFSGRSEGLRLHEGRDKHCRTEEADEIDWS